MKLKFIADVHISPTTVNELQQAGIEIKRITDKLPASASDEQIIDLAIKENAIIITQDLDFSDLIVQSGLTKPSVISIRINKPIPNRVTDILINLLPKITEELSKGCIVSVSETRFRIRQLPVN